MSDDWDVDSYKSEFENEEHWQLRRNFMLAHKDKFPEDQLVCLAQAFTNVEFMGCRYPDETMVRIAELAKGVVEKFREERKNCLKRTFVAASDAASAKAKGRTNKPKEFDTSKRIEKIEKTEENSQSTKEEIIKEEISDGVDISNLSEVKSNLMEQDKESEVCSLSNLDEKTGSLKLTREERWKARLKKFVLVLSSENENPIAVLRNSVDFNKFCLRWNYEAGENLTVNCQFFLNNRLIATCNGINRAVSKEQTAMAVVSKFRESHYAIKMKCEFSADTIVTPAHIYSGQFPWANIKQTSIGSKESSIVSVPKESSVVSVSEESSVVSVPEESSVVSVPEKSSIFSVPEGSSVVSVPEGSSVVSFPKESSVVLVPKESSVVSVPEKSSIVSVPEKSSIVSVPKEPSVVSVPKKYSVTSVPKKSSHTGSVSKKPSSGLREDNIGRKIMLLMGWKGGGLGPHEQGIKDPIIAAGRHTRKGLGNPEKKKKKKNPTIVTVQNKKKDLGSAKQKINSTRIAMLNAIKDVESQKKNPELLQPIQNPATVTVQKTEKGPGCGPLSAAEQAEKVAFSCKARELIVYWMKNKLDEKDLVFSSEFSSEERKMIHWATVGLHTIKSRSYGKGSNRHIVIYRKPKTWNIVEELLKMGGSSEKYELLHPTKTQTQLPFFCVFHHDL